MSGPLPVQVCTWLPSQSEYIAALKERGPSLGQWLYCLRDTEPGNRQTIWSGVDGGGFVAVVDFSGEVRPRHDCDGRIKRGLYEGWGRFTRLGRPVDVAIARSHPVLKQRFARSIQNVQKLTDKESLAIKECAGSLPRSASFEGFEADWSESSGEWGQYSLPREEIVEEIVLNKGRVARKLGFPSPVNPDGRKRRLSNGRYPDLWCTDGVVGEVKNQVTARWGPEQIEDYIEQCDLQWPEHAWRGVLVQGEPEMAPNAVARLNSSRYRDRLEVWTVQKGRRRITVDQLFP